MANWRKTYSFVKHAGLPVLVFACRAVDETVAQGVIVDAMVSTHSVRRGTREPFHPVLRDRTLCKTDNRKELRLFLFFFSSSSSNCRTSNLSPNVHTASVRELLANTLVLHTCCWRKLRSGCSGQRSFGKRCIKESARSVREETILGESHAFRKKLCRIINLFFRSFFY